MPERKHQRYLYVKMDSFLKTFIDSSWILHHAFRLSSPLRLPASALCPCIPLPPIKTKFKRKANNQPTKTNKQNYHHTMDSFRVKVKTRISHPCKRTEKTSTLTIKLYPFWLNCPHAPLPTL